MDFAVVGNVVRTKPAALVAAVGRPAVATVGIAGLSVGFFAWYAVALRSPHHAAYLDLTLLLALVAGVIAVFAAWLAYGRYFARRTNVDEIVALQYDAICWSALVLLWAMLFPPRGGHSTDGWAVVAIGLWVLGKIAVAARFNRTVREVAVTFLVTRLPLLAIAELAAVVIGQRPGTHYAASANPLLAVWGRWDAEHYLGIAQHGYFGTEAAFFPLYPLLIRIVGVFLGSHLLAGLVISNAASFLSLLYLYKLIEHQYNRHVAQRATFYVSIFPTAIFFSAVYTESLFLFLTVASFYYLRERRWLVAGAFGFFAALTRSEGILLIAPMAIEWVLAIREGGREYLRYTWSDVVRPLLAMVLVPLGLATYMGYLWVLSGDPLLFSHVQIHWNRHLAWPWVSILHTVHTIQTAHAQQTIANQILELAFTLLMLGVLFAGLRRLRLSYIVYMALSILVPLSTSSLLSMPRFALVLFPMFALLALWGARPAINNAYVAFSLPLLGLFTVLFADWYWVA